MNPNLQIDHLAEIASCYLANSGDFHIVLVQKESDAQNAEALLKGFLGNRQSHVATLPGFAQVGVFRFESARRIIAHRLQTLQRLSNGDISVLICSINGFFRLAPSLKWIETNSLTLTTQDEGEPDLFSSDLEKIGYTKTQRVEEIGEFAMRGGIVDLWSPGWKNPGRIEFFGSTIERIRHFRASDQRSYESAETLTILPCREFLWPQGEALEHAINHLNAALLAQSVTGRARANLLENLQCSVPFPGIDDLANEFFEGSSSSILDILHDLSFQHNRKIFLSTPCQMAQLRHEATEITTLYDNAYAAAHGKSHLSARHRYLFPDLLAFAEKGELPLSKETKRPSTPLREIHAPLFALPNSITETLARFGERKFATRLSALQQLLNEGLASELLLTFRSNEVFQELRGLLARAFSTQIVPEAPEILPCFDCNVLLGTPIDGTAIATNVEGVLTDIDGLFWLPKQSALVVSDSWLQGHAHLDNSIELFAPGAESANEDRQATIDFMVQQFADFGENECVVHMQYGIGRFLGLATITVEGVKGDFLVIEYNNHDKIYVPVDRMNLIQRYVGSGSADSPTLDSLKSSTWEKRKAKARADAEKVAKELMEHQAKRAMTPGHAFSPLGADFFDFEGAFPFDETPDQLRAIREIMTDMSKPRAMDRLLVGDVGFGKTEVAMRAAWRTVLDGKQVAWLVPTTVLAHQHARSLKERFQEFGAKIALLDRSAGSRTVSTLASGEVDICVGTHRLLSKDIRFSDLGLLVVDEEQRFGVLQKEKIKTLSYGIDVLTLTATPIPRTLQMAMVGLRDLSLLTTPPKARLAIKTFVCPFDETIIRDAILFETARGGQCFYVHNRVEELPAVLEFLTKIVPDARVCVGHGKMAQKELDETIVGFLEQKYDILLCTTIIESGIDMPNVNTILVQNADQFGLSQLYQIRGRVGRRSTRGYSYFLVSSDRAEHKDGLDRLEILKEHQDLGSGFAIASRDLEMRGSGNILGDDQSGNLAGVGLETYNQMLDAAIKNLGGIKVRAEVDVELKIPLPTHIPEDYITNARERLKAYRRFFGARSEEALQSLALECEDRFGPLPDSVRNLVELVRLRRWLLMIGAVSLVVGEDFTELKMASDVLQARDDEDAEILVRRILEVCNRLMRGVRLTPDGRILMNLRRRKFASDAPGAIAELKQLLGLLAGETYAASSI